MGSTSRGRSSNTMALVGVIGHVLAVVAFAVPSIRIGRELVKYLRSLAGGSWWLDGYRYISVPHQQLVAAVLALEALAMLGMCITAIQLVRWVFRRLIGARVRCFAALMFNAVAAATSAFSTAAYAHGSRGPTAVEQVIPILLAFVATCFFLAVVLVGSTRYTAHAE